MILLTCFGLVVIINLAYYTIFSRFSFSRPTVAKHSGVFPVSVIVCAKNEADNLKRSVPQILKQDYGEFELILVNDRSNDDTHDVMKGFARKDNRIEIVDVEPNESFWGSKKYALTLGIKRAIHKRMLFTDADCVPSSDQWIREMTRDLNQEKQIVLGYGAYESEPTFLNKLIRFETMLTAVQYMSYALSGIPYMGVGRNLAYTANLFYDTRGFMSHMDIRSGDDDLFVNEAANSENVSVQTSKSSFTYSKPETDWQSWIRQKKRHYSTSARYKLKHKTLLSIFYFGNLLFWPLFFIAWYPGNWITWGILGLLRFSAQYLVLGKAAERLGERKFIPLIPILEVFLVLIQLSIFISGSRSKQAIWK